MRAVGSGRALSVQADGLQGRIRGGAALHRHVVRRAGEVDLRRRQSALRIPSGAAAAGAPRQGRPASRRRCRSGRGCSARFGVLAKFKVLRGTPLDPFGYTAERRTERRLIADYEKLLGEIVERSDAGQSSLSPSRWLHLRRKSAASATSSCGISPPPRPRKPPCTSNSAPAPRRFSRRRNNLAALCDQIPTRPRLDRPAAVFSYRGNKTARRGGEGWEAAPRTSAAEREEQAVATIAAAPADTFPKLLIRNALICTARGRRCGTRISASGRPGPGAQVLEIVRAYAVGLHRLGLKRGETIAIVGANRPKLYWSVMAAQMLGAVPVPVYADAVADELAFVLAHAEVRFAAVEDQEQIDKIMSVMERLPKLEQMVYDERRGLARLRSQPSASDRRRHRGRAQGARGRSDASAPGSMPRSPPARAPIRRSFSTPPAPPARPRAWC